MAGSSRVLGRAVLLGVVAGMRTQLPLALIAAAATRGQFAASSSPPLSLLNSPAALPVLCLSAVGEIVADKLPITPSRLKPGPLCGRVLFGGLAGAAVTLEADRPALAGVMLGATGAGLAAFAGYHLRVWLGETTGLPDPIWGAAEDIVAISLGRLALSD